MMKFSLLSSVRWQKWQKDPRVKPYGSELNWDAGEPLHKCYRLDSIVARRSELKGTIISLHHLQLNYTVSAVSLVISI